MPKIDVIALLIPYLSPTLLTFSQSDSFVGGQPASTLSEVENDCKEEPKTILRRRSSVTKMIKSPEFVINNLDKQFFTPDFDPVLHQLHALEQWDSAEMMERFMSTIEETDTDKDMVLVKLAEMIEINYSELMGCMRDVSTRVSIGPLALTVRILLSGTCH